MRDVVIIGSGAGGGPLALRLSEAGCDVLVLERGPRYTREDFSHDEVVSVRRDFWKSSIDDDPHWLQRAGVPWIKPTDLGWLGSCVGGGTARYGGHLYRFHPDDFRMRSDSFLSPGTHSLDASFRNPKTGSLRGEAVKLALAGESGVVTTTDYRGEEALIAYGPVDVLGVRWAGIAKMDVNEAYAASHDIVEEKERSAAALFKVNAALLFASLAIVARRKSRPSVVSPTRSTWTRGLAAASARQ